MKFIYIFGLLFSVTVLAATWSPEDYEIFKLKDKIEQDLGKGVNFYSWLNLENGPKSTLDQINKAYRKKSRQIHPDKLHSAKKAVKKKAEERFQRLSSVGNILRDQSLKKRYDYFLKNGFPKWRGTGYLYTRFRPGIVATFVFLFVVIGLFHYVSLTINRKQDFRRIVNLKDEVKSAAWNGSIVPPQDGGDRKVVHPGNGRELIVHNNGDVSLVENDEEGNVILHKLDENDIKVNVDFKDTLFFRVPVALYNLTLGKAFGIIDTSEPVEVEQEEKKPKKKNKNKGERIELPNGKVIYGRKNLKKRK